MMRMAQCCLIVVLLGADKPPEPRFRDVEIEADFEPYLTSNRLLMEVTEPRSFGGKMAHPSSSQLARRS